MQAYALLGLAIVAEISGTTALKLSDGMTKLWPSLGVVLGYGASFWFLSKALQTLPIGFSYAMWAGVGVGAVAVIGHVVFGETLSWQGVLGLVLIVGGMVLLQTSVQSAR